MKIIEPSAADDLSIDSLANLSVRASKAHAPNWLRTIDDGRKVVEEALQPEKVCRALMDGGRPLGWVTAGPLFGRVWELHPLLIDPDHQRRGYGRLLAEEIERFAIDAGALTLLASTSDMTGATTLSGKDLYADPMGELSLIDIIDQDIGHALQFGATLVTAWLVYCPTPKALACRA